MQIILASRSPRRKLLLEKIIPKFSIQPSNVDESSIIAKTPRLFALAAAMAKAQDVSKRSPQALVIAADTVVVLDQKILGKPLNPAQAAKMLTKLSGRGHTVITAVALARDAKIMASDYQETKVLFHRLKPADIEKYTAGNDPWDKAGSYGIQTIGDKFVKKINGDYDNVVGLPLTLVKKLLADFADYDEILEITDVALPMGAGVAKKEGKVFFVSRAVYGDTVRAKVTGSKKNFFNADTVKVEKASPCRTKPKCRHFGVCGGCVFQDLAYPQQLKIKARHLLNTLRRMGGLDFPADRLEIVGAAKKYFYRNKVEFTSGLGLTQCPIFSASAPKILKTVQAFSSQFKKLVVKESKADGALMVILAATEETALADQLAEKLIKENKKVKSVWLAVGQNLRHIAGEKHIAEFLGDLKFNIWPQTFFQTNTRMALALYQKVRDFFPVKVGPALGLYCGSGALEVFCAPACRTIVGIDSDSANVANAQENARLNNLTNCAFLRAHAEAIPLNAVDLIMVDPPRQGLSPRALENLKKISASTLIYVSCEPASLSRDLKILCAHGYRLSRLAMVDMFPQTGHLEAVALLEK